jgi:putative ubiquitin-RnfH superfamily antitoxin RatB of RatAB toxin-antitoxin module
MRSRHARPTYSVSADTDITIEVVAAWPGHQVLRTVTLPAGSTVGEAIDAADLGREFPEIDFGRYDVAVWGRVVTRGQPVGDGDRVEILRPLEIDPRDARRHLAREGQFMGRRRETGDD